MEEAEGFLGSIIEPVPVSARSFQEGEGPNDVGLDELGGSMDGAIHMGLSGKVHNGAGTVLSEELGNKFRISDIASNEDMAGIPLDGGKVLEIARVGELVEVDDGVFLEGNPVEDKVGTDEAGTACYEDGRHDC